MILDVQEEEAKVLEDGSCEAHDEKGRHDHHPAVAPVRRSGSPGLHLYQVTLQASPACAEWLSCNKSDKPQKVGRAHENEHAKHTER